ncbi:MAG TPA: hypothetical protein VNC50_06695, partial [Planctomycetia bacterium]|nr:hypothetical protein [Planctomycetia bacterium]
AKPVEIAKPVDLIKKVEGPAPSAPKPLLSSAPRMMTLQPPMQGKNAAKPAAPASPATAQPAIVDLKSKGTGEITQTALRTDPSAPRQAWRALLQKEQIPEGSAERRAKAKELLTKGRDQAAADNPDGAEESLFIVRELGVDFSRFEYGPKDLERDIARSWSRTGRASGTFPVSAFPEPRTP